MEKLLVIRCVVPLIVITPTTATTTQNRATSALWRSTKRVSAVIAILHLPRPAAVPPTLVSLPPGAPSRRPAAGVTCRYHRGSNSLPPTPGGVRGSSTGGG